MNEASVVPGTVLLSRPRRPDLGANVNRALQGLLRGQRVAAFSHAAVLLDTNLVIESTPKTGVAVMGLQRWGASVDLERSRALVPDVEALKLDPAAIRAAFEYEMKVEYGYNFLKQLKLTASPDSVFCSQLVSRVYGRLIPSPLWHDHVLPIDLYAILDRLGFDAIPLAELVDWRAPRVAWRTDGGAVYFDDLPARVLTRKSDMVALLADVRRATFNAVATNALAGGAQADLLNGGGFSIGSDLDVLDQVKDHLDPSLPRLPGPATRLVAAKEVGAQTIARLLELRLHSSRAEASRLLEALVDLLALRQLDYADADGQVTRPLVAGFFTTWQGVVSRHNGTFVAADMLLNKKDQTEAWIEELAAIGEWIEQPWVPAAARELWLITEAAAVALEQIAAMALPWTRMANCLKKPDPEACFRALGEKHRDVMVSAFQRFADGETGNLVWAADLLAAVILGDTDSSDARIEVAHAPVPPL